MMSAPHRITLTCASDTARERLALLDACIGPNWGFSRDLTDGGGPLFRALCTPRSATITTLNVSRRKFAEQHTHRCCVVYWSTCRRCWSSICQVRSVAIDQQATDSITDTELGDDGLIAVAPAFQCLRNLRALKLSGSQLYLSIDSSTHQYQIAKFVWLDSEHWHLSSNTCHHCSC